MDNRFQYRHLNVSHPCPMVEGMGGWGRMKQYVLVVASMLIIEISGVTSNRWLLTEEELPETFLELSTIANLLLAVKIVDLGRSWRSLIF